MAPKRKTKVNVNAKTQSTGKKPPLTTAQLTLQERKERERLRSAKRRAEKKQTGSSKERTFESTFVVTARKNTKLGATQSRKANSPAPTADIRKREPAEKSHRIESRRGDLQTGPESNLTQFDLWGQPVQMKARHKERDRKKATPDQPVQENLWGKPVKS